MYHKEGHGVNDRKEHIMAKRAAKGAGSISKRTYTRNGKEYTYWVARVTTGRDPLTGRQVSAPMIKCKKTPRKKCSFVAEVKGKR